MPKLWPCCFRRGGRLPARNGGIFNSGRLTLIDTRVIDNAADFGGGIRNDRGTIALRNCTVSGNSAAFAAGGILNQAGLITLNGTSSVTGNRLDDCVGVPPGVCG